MTPLLELRHLRVYLSHSATPQPLVHDVTLSIDAGEAVGLVGESGSGKSLTARAVASILPPGLRADGERRFQGRQISAMSKRELREFHTHGVAMIFQDPRAHINPVHRIGDFLTEALVTNERIRRPDAERTMTRILTDVGITEPARRLHQYPWELSGGMLQRVMIAAAIATEPALLVADEPTTALDVTIQEEVAAILNDLRRNQGMGMLFITHDLDLAAAICDRTAVMYAGSIAEVRASAELHQHPRHPYTAALGGSRPDITARVQRLPVISGQPQSGLEIGAGCAFASRCAYADDLCHQQRPALRPLAEGLVACHHADALSLTTRQVGTHG